MNVIQTALLFVPAHMSLEMKFNEVKGDIILMPPDEIIGAATDTVILSCQIVSLYT